MRLCRICRAIKPLAEFYMTGDKRYRVRRCRTCAMTAQRERRKLLDYKARQKARAGHLRRKYGLIPQERDRLAAQQAWRCAICDIPVRLVRADIKDALHIDHDHNNGVVRGILCFQCNTGLGKFGDSVELLRKAADYLERDVPEVIYRSRYLSAEEQYRSRSAAASHAWDARLKKGRKE